MIHLKEEKEHYAAFVSTLGYDPNDFQYQQNNIVVRLPTFWDNLLDEGDGGMLLGYNFRGSPVRQFFYGGTAPGNVGFTRINPKDVLKLKFLGKYLGLRAV